MIYIVAEKLIDAELIANRLCIEPNKRVHVFEKEQLTDLVDEVFLVELAAIRKFDLSAQRVIPIHLNTLVGENPYG